MVDKENIPPISVSTSKQVNKNKHGSYLNPTRKMDNQNLKRNNGPPSEQGPVATDNELVHNYLVNQSYFQIKYKFTKPFHLLVN
jgi:hypothetical protein